MAKARVGMYEVKGDTLTRTHRTCPKCGPGWFLAEHSDRRSCGHCGYMERKVSEPTTAPPVKAPAAKPARSKAPKAPAAPTPPAPAS